MKLKTVPVEDRAHTKTFIRLTFGHPNQQVQLKNRIMNGFFRIIVGFLEIYFIKERLEAFTSKPSINFWTNIALNVRNEPVKRVATRSARKNRNNATLGEFHVDWLPQMAVCAVNVNLGRPKAKWLAPKFEKTILAERS